MVGCSGRFVAAEREHVVSHFCVVVIGEDVAGQLAPYQENNMGDCPEKFLAFTEDEDASVDHKTGKRGYWENPNRKWDYWRVGGRYGGRLKVKDGVAFKPTERGWDSPPLDAGFTDQARLGDIDWDDMRAKRLADREQWWAEYQQKKGEGAWVAYEYGVQEGDTRETYVARGEDFSCFAVVKNGKWYEKGKMGWWAVVSDEKEAGQWQGELKALLSDLPSDALITVVDCHI